MYWVDDRVRINMDGPFKGAYGTVTSVGQLDWYEVLLDMAHMPTPVSFKNRELVPEQVPVTAEEWTAYEAWWLTQNEDDMHTRPAGADQ